MTGSPELAIVAALVLGLALGILLALGVARVGRRGLYASSREIVRAAEDLAEGRFDRPASLASDDPLSTAAAALARLANANRAHTGDLERRLKLSEELLAVARGTALVVTDGLGEIRYASPGAESLLDWKPGEGAGQRIEALFDNAAELEDLLPKLMRRSIREAPVRQEVRLRRRDGSTMHAELTIGTFRQIPGGGGDGLLFEIRDLTAEDALRDELRASEERHRTLAERVPIGVLVVQKGRIVYSNSALRTLLQAKTDTEGTDFRDILDSEDLLRVFDAVRRIESGEIPELETDVRILPFGERWPIEITLSAARIQFGGAPAVIGSIRETGEDHGILRSIRVSETKLDAALGASEEGVLLLSDMPSGGTVILASRRFEEILGLPARTLAGQSRGELAETLAQQFTDPEAAQSEVDRLLARDGDRAEDTSVPRRAFELSVPAGESVRYAEFSVRPARDRDGRTIGRLLSTRDVTAPIGRERRLAAEAAELTRTRDMVEQANRDLAALNAELSARTTEVGRANQELRALDEMKSNLLANVSHELQTPLVSIKGYTDMILKGRLGAITDEQRKGLEVSLRNIDRLIGMIQNLLSFSRIEKDMAGLNITPFALPELIEESIELVREPAEARRIALTSRYQTDDLEVRGDREKIGQVFTNLLSNAVKYNRDGGQVQIDVRRGRAGYLLVDVRDTGVGIARESLDRIFDRYYRTPGAASGAAPGTGLGLAIARDILRMHGCIIKVDSAPGEGTVFTFTLPVVSRPKTDGPATGGSPQRAAEELR